MKKLHTLRGFDAYSFRVGFSGLKGSAMRLYQINYHEISRPCKPLDVSGRSLIVVPTNTRPADSILL
ncbi:MAG: hypothetical protein ACTXOO_04005 [Sodalis sp. (in: enterobacteria)]